MTRCHGTDDEDKWKLGSRVVQGLSGEALKVAMTFGFAKLTENDAVPKPIEDMRGHLFPMSTAEARELCRAGQRPGVLSRQSGEPWCHMFRGDEDGGSCYTGSEVVDEQHTRGRDVAGT